MTSAPGKIVLLGGSAGGIEAVGLILQVLPADVDAALFVVVHLNPSVPSFLPDILQRRTKLHVVSARDGAAIVAGTVYVAPPDRHLTIHDGHVHVARGPLENYLRPAVDPLFRSAAAAYGVDVIGVVLSGNLNDGTTGLDLIKKLGGTAIVQDPADALYPGMPANALQEVSGVDHVLPAAAIGQRILALVNESRVQSNTPALDVEPDIVIGRPDPHGHTIKE